MSEAEQNPEPVLDTKPKPFVFVLMPFDTAFTDVYQLGIKPACEKAGAYAERLDEQLFTESMLQRICNQIAKADVVVADMTGRNPNVFYEVGYAHALGKVVILLTQKGEDIPFDLKHYRHIVYDNVTGLLSELETVVQWSVKQAGEKTSSKVPITVYCQNKPLLDRPALTLVLRGKEDIPQLVLTYGNTDEISVVQCRMALWTSDIFLRCWWEGQKRSMPVNKPPLYPVVHPTGTHVFTCPVLMSLLPAEWRTDTVFLRVRDLENISPDTAHYVTLRISTQSGSYSYPFTVRIVRER